jgi:putative ABC transport system substrate-binding protein
MGTDPAQSDVWQPFLDGMRELGYVEGQNLFVKRAFGNLDRLPSMVAELVAAGVDVIVTTGPRETRAVQQATATIPIVMTFVYDPVAEGLVKSLARPGTNATGVTSLVPGLSQKYVELLKEAVPTARRFGVVTSPRNPPPTNRHELEDAVKARGMSVSFLSISAPADFDSGPGKARRNRRYHRHVGWRHVPASAGPRRGGTETPPARDVLGARIRGGGRPHDLQRQPCRSAPARGDLCRQGPQGREAR